MAGAFGWRIFSGQLPQYEGKTAAEWLGPVYTTNRPLALEAFHGMGPKALPFILQELQSRETSWNEFYVQKYPSLPLWLKQRLRKPILQQEMWARSRAVLFDEQEAHTMLPELTR